MNTTFFVTLLLTLLLVFGSTFARAQGGTQHVPVTDGNQYWTGLNVYDFGGLQFATTPPACPAGEFVTGLDTTFSPLCGSPSGIANGPVLYPAQCQQSGNIPSWCGASGQTADVYIRAACGQLPSSGGFINLVGLTGTIANQVPCSTPTKLVYTLADNTSHLTIMESDGKIVFPQDYGSAMLGQGAGQCPLSGGIHLGSSANVQAIVGPAHVDGTQESFAASGLCLYGVTGATVTNGLAYAKSVYTNTQIVSNNLAECNNACVWVEDVGGAATVAGNWMNVTDGAYGITGSDLVIIASDDIDVFSNTMEHANGGTNYPEVRIAGDGSGNSSNSIWLHNNYIERNQLGTPDTSAICITDCQSCSVRDVGGAGTTGGTNFVLVQQTAPGRTANVILDNVLATAWTNVLNDTVTINTGVTLPVASSYLLSHYTVSPGFSDGPCSALGAAPGYPYTGQCWNSLPDYRTNINAPSGLQQFAWLSDLATLPHSLGADQMAGAGSFATGNANFGTGFVQNGCKPSQGTTCTYTRTNSTAPSGYVYSQEVQITANTDTSTGLNGIQYSTAVSYTQGQALIASFWMKGDGSFTGKASFILGDETIPTYYCQDTSGNSLTTSWEYFTFVCVPPSSGASYLQVVAATPAGAVGTFWVSGFQVTPEAPLTSGAILTAVGPYGLGAVPGTIYSAAGTPLPTCNAADTGAQFMVGDASSPTYLGTYTSGGSTKAVVLCDGSAWRTH